MPVDKVTNVGCGPDTELKEEHFRGIVSIIAGAAKGAMNHQRSIANRCFWAYELNAGSGMNEYNGNVFEGSPLIALDVLRNLQLPYRAVFMDNGKDNIDNLRVLAGNDPNVTCVLANNADYMRSHCSNVGRDCYGYVFHDPNGVDDFNADMLLDIFNYPAFHRIDLIINIGATSFKRVLGAFPNRQDARLDTAISRLVDRKKVWLVREPYGKNQWTFLVGSNWVKLPDWKRQGFFRMDSPEGEDILDRLMYTGPQLEEMEYINRRGKQSFWDYRRTQKWQRKLF